VNPQTDGLGQEAGPSATPQDDKVIAEVAAPHFVQGMGLFSATAIVMGSMIGSGIFIVPADMSRVLDSPALLIAAWLVTAAMTVIGALSYGELAAMMPKAGGQYVYLREALGPIWGFLYGWTLFVVIQTGTIAAVGVAFGKFLGVFFPSVSQTHWIVHIGSGNIGLSTANLAAIVVITLLTFANTRGVKLGSAVQNVFTSAKVLALLAVIAVGFVAKNAVAVAANFGAGWQMFWAGANWHAPRTVDVGSFFGMGGGTAVVGIFTVVAVVQVGSLFSSDAWNNVTFTAGEIKNPKRNLPLSLAIGTGVVLLLYIACNFVYLSVLPLEAIAHGGDANCIRQRGLAPHVGLVRHAQGTRRSRSDWQRGREADGRGDSGLDLRVCERDAAGRGACLLRDEQGWPVLQGGGQARSEDRCADELAVDAVGVDLPAVFERAVWRPARLRDLRGTGVLCADNCWAFRAAPDAAGRATALPGGGVSGAARALYRDGGLDLWCTVAIQASVHMAGIDPGVVGSTRVSGVEETGNRE
jgi:hypothetical protein